MLVRKLKDVEVNVGLFERVQHRVNIALCESLSNERVDVDRSRNGDLERRQNGKRRRTGWIMEGRVKLDLDRPVLVQLRSLLGDLGILGIDLGQQSFSFGLQLADPTVCLGFDQVQLTLKLILVLVETVDSRLVIQVLLVTTSLVLISLLLKFKNLKEIKTLSNTLNP